VLVRETREHHITITLDRFLEAGEVHSILERASNRFDKVTKYWYNMETDALRFVYDSLDKYRAILQDQMCFDGGRENKTICEDFKLLLSKV
jgi:hypothetical protein